MRKEKVTVHDCMERLRNKGERTILNDGKLMGFQKEEIPAQTVNQSGDK